MRLEHPPRITGPPTTKTKGIRNNVSRAKYEINGKATSTVHSIRSSSTCCKNSSDSCEYKFSKCDNCTVLQVLHVRSAGLLDNCDVYNYHNKRHVRACSTALNNVTNHPADDSWPQCIRQQLQNTREVKELRMHQNNKINFSKQNYNDQLQLEITTREIFCKIKFTNYDNWLSPNPDVPDNTAFNHHRYDKTNKIVLLGSVYQKNRRADSFDLPSNEAIRSPSSPEITGKWRRSRNWREPKCRRPGNNVFPGGSIKENNSDHVSHNKCDNTAWMGESIDRRVPIHFDKNENSKINSKIFRCGSHRKSYGLLFLLYLLAWPILCSTQPSSGIVASVSFLQKSSLVRIDNFTIRNLSKAARLRSGDSRIDLESNKEHGEASEQVHPYNEYTWDVNQINPWLSACDMAGPAPADLQGSCGPPEVPKYCPIPCSRNSNSDRIFREIIERIVVPIKWRTDPSETVKWKIIDGTVKGSTARDQCLFYLEESHKQDICRDNFAQSSLSSFTTPQENRYWFLSGLRLRHCCEHAVINALAPGKGGPLEDVLNGGRKCIDALDKILIVDALAARLHCEFEEVLARYDCGQSYSVIHNCTHCKEAYRKWVCSSLVPYFAHEGLSDSLTSTGAYIGTRLRPCRSFCQSVEQRCPYLLPGDRAPAYPTQYAGEPTFLCRDPNIPETGEQAVKALHGDMEEECCFRVCSEEEPGSGVCANCTASEPHGRRIGRDPPSAPLNCPTGQNSLESGSELSTAGLPSITSSSSSFCSGSLSTSSSASSNTASIMLLCLFWIWAALISSYSGQVLFPWRPALDAGFASSSLHLMRTSADESIPVKHQPSSRILAPFVRMTEQLCHILFLYLFRALFLCYQGHLWCWCVLTITSGSSRKILKRCQAESRVNLREQDINYDNENGQYLLRRRERFCYRSCSTRRKARIRNRKPEKRRRGRFWFNPWKWKGPS